MKTSDKSANARQKNIFLSLAVVFGGVFVIIFLATTHLQATETNSSYANWVKPWAERPATSEALGSAELKLIVSLVAGETDLDAFAKMTPVERLAVAYRIQVAATEVAANGASRDYFVSNTSAKNNPTRQFTPAEFEKIIAALAQLPADNSKLPPAGRRVVVQVRENGKWHVSVYDGKNLPPEVKTLLEQLANPYAATL